MMARCLALLKALFRTQLWCESEFGPEKFTATEAAVPRAALETARTLGSVGPAIML